MWNVSQVIDMSEMFAMNGAFNQDLHWDTSSLENAEKMFAKATGFNGDLSTWDVSKVRDFKSFLAGAYSFDRSSDLEHWEMKSAENIAFFAEFAFHMKGNFCEWNKHLPADAVKTMAFVGTMCDMPNTPSDGSVCDICME